MAVWGLVCLGALLGIGWLVVEKGAITPYREAIEEGEEGDADAQHSGGDQGQVAPSSAVRTAPPIPTFAPAAHPPSLQELAERGDADAQLRLGKAYANGEGAPKDAGQAALWYRKAAEQGVAEAQYALGALYDAGNGVTKDTGEALEWYRKAAEQGHGDAAWMLSQRLPVGIEGNHWYVEAHRMYAEQGLASAQYDLGGMYLRGLVVPYDAGEAAHWFRKAADQGIAEAQAMLGDSYYLGRGVSKDAREAAVWYRKAADQGYAIAQRSLATLYSRGEGVHKDRREAAQWYRKAANQGDARAQTGLGLSYATGDGVPADYVQAYAWLNLAAAQGFEQAGQARDRLQRNMTPTQIAEAQKLSRELVD